MDGIPKDKSNGYMCNSSDDAISDGILRRTSFDSMSEGMNEEGNGEEEEERGDNEKKEGTLASHQKEGLFGKVRNASLWMMLGSLL
ncbi:unnamed protein product [Sphagnum tenellum]